MFELDIEDGALHAFESVIVSNEIVMDGTVVELTADSEGASQGRVVLGERSYSMGRVIGDIHAIEEAVAQYQACQQAGASEGELSATRWTIGSNARRAVTERAARNDCGGAQSAARSAASIGAGEKAQDALQKSGC